MEANEKHGLISGGGTGGHVFPGLAVAEELAGRGWRVTWAGRAAGMERELVEARGLPYLGLPAAALVGRGPLAQAGALATLAVAVPKALVEIRRRRVDALLGTGGYVCAPAVMAAGLARLPALLFEPNARAGAANRWLSRWVRGAAVAFDEAAAELHCPARRTGIPVRAAFHHREARTADGPPRILVLGGSQGASQLNRLVPPAIVRVAEDHSRLQVVHQVGAAHLEEARKAWEARDRDRVEVRLETFLEDVAAEMERANVVVSRAGAVTLAEICAVGRAAVLVPLALAAGHQRANAERLVAAGGAEILAPGEETPEAMAEALSGLLDDPVRRERMGRALRELARPQAAAEIADWMEELTEAA